MKKLLAVLLCAVLMFGLAMPVAALSGQSVVEEMLAGTSSVFSWVLHALDWLFMLPENLLGPAGPLIWALIPFMILYVAVLIAIIALPILALTGLVRFFINLAG
ncbi:MAG: hypothetical protein FWD06_05460 [Oscillospiraceae bacterium]|nr:hypothetical protein [Oscillospiraceae bacterium]